MHYSASYKKAADRRFKNYTKSIRKSKIAKNCYGFDWYNNIHQYSKNKVHCSCALCAFSGKPIQDIRTISSMDDAEYEYFHT